MTIRSDPVSVYEEYTPLELFTRQSGPFPPTNRIALYKLVHDKPCDEHRSGGAHRGSSKFDPEESLSLTTGPRYSVKVRKCFSTPLRSISEPLVAICRSRSKSPGSSSPLHLTSLPPGNHGLTRAEILSSFLTFPPTFTSTFVQHMGIESENDGQS